MDNPLYRSGADSAELRKAAEAKLQSVRPADAAAARDQLMEELQIHQFELEMQNENLRQSERELYATREEYLNLFDFAPIPYFTLDLKGQIRKLNLAAAEVLGRPRQFFAQGTVSLFHFVGAHSRAVLAGALAGLEKDRHSVAADIALLGAGGEKKQYRIKAARIYGRAGSESILCGLVETTWEHTSRYIQEAFHAHNLVTVTDASGVITDANPLFCQVSGYSRDELVGATHQKLHSGVHGDKFYKDIKDTVVSGKIWRGDVCKRAKDGRLFWLETTIYPVLSESGRPEAYIYIRTDTTRLKMLVDQEREQQEMLRRMSLSLPGALFRAKRSKEGALQVLWANNIALDLLGIDPAQLPAGGEALFTTAHPDDAAAFRAALERSASTGTLLRSEQRRRTPGGMGWRWVYAEATPYIEVDGSVVWHGYATDIDGRKEIEKKLQETNSQLERLNQTKSEFLGMCAHDLRGPLQNIAGYAALLLEDLSEQPERCEFVEMIAKSSQKMESLVGSLLSHNAIERGRYDWKIERQPVAPLLKNVTDMLAVAARAKDIAVLICPDPAAVACLDAIAFDQIASNLVSNAIKYTPPHKRIEVILEQIPGAARLIVRDQGPGLSDDERKRLFGAFEKLGPRPTGGESSHGLGLHIALQLAEGMGATLTCESRLGEGSAFILTVPDTASVSC